MEAIKSGSALVTLKACAAALLMMGSAFAVAALDVTIDRDDIRVGETAQITISSDGDADPDDADLSVLREKLRILQRSSNTRTELINGRRTQRRDLILEVTPLREGNFVIPAFTIDGERSQALSITVRPELELSASEEIVLFEAEADRDEVYVQGQLLLTLRIQQAVNLDSRSVTDLQLDGAFVKSLGQNSFQRTVNGRPWLVHEIRYAVFPETSGELRIPTQTFSGRLSSGRRSLFDNRPSGQLIQRSSDELVISVKPRPASFTDPTWLPASELTLEEQWSAPAEEIRVGDSITRTVTVTGEGLQGAQLPPITIDAGDGLRVYPDQPGINDMESARGVTGIRTDSIALVAVRAGEYELPPITVNWWDTQSDRPRQATLPARKINVVAGAIPPGTNAPDTQLDATTLPSAPQLSIPASGVWPWLTALCATGWILTTFFLWLRTRPPSEEEASPTAKDTRRKEVLAACRTNDPLRTRRQLRQWLLSQGHGGTIEEWTNAVGNPELIAAVEELEQQLYGTETSTAVWEGKRLADALRTLPSGKTTPSERGSDLPPLYAS